MANSDRNELSYSTSDPSGGSGEQPVAGRNIATAMPAVALPVLGRPMTQQALRRPPSGDNRRTQSQGISTRAAGRRGRERELPQRRQAALEDEPRVAAPSPSEASRRRREDREAKRARRDRADRELRSRSVSSSEPEMERGADRTRSPPLQHVAAVSVTRVSMRATPAGSSGSNSASDIGRGVLIDTPRAPSLNLPMPSGSIPWRPDQPITVTERTEWWERSGLDFASGPAGPPFVPGPGYVGDVESLPIRGTSLGSQAPLPGANAEDVINALRSELRLAERHSQLSEEQVTHVALIASGYQAAADRHENQAAADRTHAAWLEAQVQLERQRTHLSEQQVSHVASVANSTQAAASRAEHQAAALEMQIQLERQRTAHVASLGENQAGHLIGQVASSNASVVAAEETAERERTRATNCEHIAAASDRALGAYQAEFGTQLAAQLDAYQRNATDEFNILAVAEREARNRTEAAALAAENREAEAATRNAREITSRSEAYWQAEATNAAALARAQATEHAEQARRAEAMAVADLQNRFHLMEHNMAEENARRIAEQRQDAERQLASYIASLRPLIATPVVSEAGSRYRDTTSGITAGAAVDHPPDPVAVWPDASLPTSPEPTDPELLAARSEAANFREECRALREEFLRAGAAPRVGAADIGGADRREAGAGRAAYISAEEREPSPALSVAAQARESAEALYYQLSGQAASEPSESAWSQSTSGGRRPVPVIYEPDEDDLYGENGIFRNLFVHPNAKTKKAERTKSRLDKNRERKCRNRERVSRRRRDPADHESESEMSDSSGDKSHIVKTRPGTGSQITKLQIDGEYPVCRDIKAWDIYVSTQCYNSAGFTDRKEYSWLEQVLKIPDDKRNSLAIVPEEMADMDKNLVKALRRENWLPKELTRDIMRLEKQFLKMTPLRTVTGQFIFYLIHRGMRLMPSYCYQTSVRHLYGIKWKGDTQEQMKSFLNVWDGILDEMNPLEVPLETTLTDLFKDQFAQSKLMQQDYFMWKRLDQDDPKKTYHHLRALMEKQMTDDTMEKNKAAQFKAHDDKAGGYDPLFGGVGKRARALVGEEKDKNKGKGKGGKRDKSWTPGGGKGGGGDRDPSKTPGGGKGGGGGKAPKLDEASRAKLAKMHCYFFHVSGHCKFGDKCTMKHVQITDALKAKLKHPKEILADLKNKAPALAVIPAGQGGPPLSCFICGEEHFARDCPQRSGGGTAQRRGDHSKGAGRGKGKGEPKGGTQPRPKSAPRKPNSPVPPHATGKAEGEKSNKEIEKEFKLPGFCKDFENGQCNRDIIGNRPSRCSQGAHLTSEGYKKLKETIKGQVKAAKEKRNRSKTPAARGPPQ